MRNLRRSKRGQFSVISALLVSVILIMAVISMYSMVRYTSKVDSPQVLTGVGEMNTDIKKILDFTVGYYCSILTVTGNSTYAKQLTTSYLSSGLVNIARSHPEWNPSFELDFDDEQVSTRWFMPNSYSMGTISVTYSLSALGIEGVTYKTSSALSVEMLDSGTPGVAMINVTRDNSEPELGLTKDNFWFYNYSYADSNWVLVNPTEVLIASNGVYTITLPAGVNQDSYSVQIEDNRGILVSAFYSANSISESGIPHYTYTFDWASTGMVDIYNSLATDTFVIELLQNGTLKWLGQPLEVTSEVNPIPPVCIKAFRVNATVNGNNQEVPFQVEDWASEYMVPLGLSGNDSIFTSRNMLVFLVNNNVSQVTLWWDGNDTAIQTPYAWQNIYFNDDPDYSSYGVLNNGLVELHINNFYVESATVGESTSCTAEFLRLNGEEPQYGDQLSYVIYNGVVRDIVQQEPEYGGGVSNCPNFYSQIVLTFPANATYYTYSARTIFINSSQTRTITDLSALQVYGEWVYGDLVDSFTEDGLSGDYPIVTETSHSTDVFYNTTLSEEWAHHWSEYIIGTSGAGVMYMNSSNFDLYAFDDLAGDKTGALSVTNEYQTGWVSPTSVYDRCGQDWDRPASNAVDGNTNSYWRHSSTEYHWIVLDMSETVPISKLRIYQGSDDWGGSAGIEVYVSDNPAVWGSAVWSGQIDGFQWEESGSFSAEGRYVKIVSLSNSSSQRLYEVDVEVVETRGTFELNPVERYQVSGFNEAMDVTWCGAVVTFDGEPIYPTSGDVGLWVMVEHPPTVSID